MNAKTPRRYIHNQRSFFDGVSFLYKFETRGRHHLQWRAQRALRVCNDVFFDLTTDSATIGVRPA